MEIRAHGRVLYTRLEAELAVCRASSTEHAMGHTVFRLIQKLLAQYLDLRALALLPLMGTDPSDPHAAEIMAIAGGYIDQANMWPECLRVATDMIDSGIFTGYGGNPALASNAAHTAMSRPFLLALLHGMARPRNTDKMLQDYAEFPATAPGPDGHPGPAGLPGPPGTPPGQRPNPDPKPTPVPLAPRPAPPSGAAQIMPPGAERGSPAGIHGLLWDVAGRPGFRTDNAGYLYHPLWYSGEYSCPFGWIPPQGATGFPAPGQAGPSRTSLTVPVAISIIASSSPFQAPPKDPFRHCHLPGHSQYECPKRFAETRKPFTSPSPGSWSPDSLTPALGSMAPSWPRPRPPWPLTSANTTSRPTANTP
jgi:hypothetical protein